MIFLCNIFQIEEGDLPKERVVSQRILFLQSINDLIKELICQDLLKIAFTKICHCVVVENFKVFDKDVSLRIQNFFLLICYFAQMNTPYLNKRDFSLAKILMHSDVNFIPKNKALIRHRILPV